MTTMETNELIDKYLEGRTSPEEERKLALEVNRADVPQEWLIIRDMLGELTLGEALYDKTVKARKRRRWISYGGWGIAASLFLCLAMGGLFPKEVQEGQPVEVAKTKSVIAEVSVAEPVVPSPVSTVPEAQPEPKKPIVERAKAKPQPVTKIAKVETPATVDSATSVEEEAPTAIDILRAQVDEAALAKVEEKYGQWQLRQAIRNEGIELEIATKELERKYEEYLADNVIEI